MSYKIAIVVSDFNADITKAMLKTAEAEIKKNNGTVSKIIHVPGSFEIPFAVQKIIEKADAVVTLGVIIQGKTAHDLIIGEAIAPKLLELSLHYNTPLGLGIIGPRVSRKEAEARAHEYASRAVHTVFSLLNLNK